MISVFLVATRDLFTSSAQFSTTGSPFYQCMRCSWWCGLIVGKVASKNQRKYSGRSETPDTNSHRAQTGSNFRGFYVSLSPLPCQFASFSTHITMYRMSVIHLNVRACLRATPKFTEEIGLSHDVGYKHVCRKVVKQTFKYRVQGQLEAWACFWASTICDTRPIGFHISHDTTSSHRSVHSCYITRRTVTVCKTGRCIPVIGKYCLLC